MATPARNPGNGREHNVMLYQMDSSLDEMGGGPCSLGRDHVHQAPTILDMQCSKILASIPLLQIQLYIVQICSI